jgi:glycosyltransferase involved in cell wall biosynthesis
MNKVVEYMTMGKPIVSFDLHEAKVSAGPAARYVAPNDTSAFAAAIDELLRDPEQRAAMGSVGKERVHKELSWEMSRRKLLELYGRLA